jgi:hypothetical protein
VKGTCFLHASRNDSAEHYFRLYLAHATDLNDKEAANQFAYLGITLDSDLEKYAGAVNTIREILEKGSVKEEKPIKHTKRNKFYKNED